MSSPFKRLSVVLTHKKKKILAILFYLIAVTRTILLFLYEKKYSLKRCMNNYRCWGFLLKLLKQENNYVLRLVYIDKYKNVTLVEKAVKNL